MSEYGESAGQCPPEREPERGSERGSAAPTLVSRWRAASVRWHAAAITGRPWWSREEGQATAEYGLVVVAAAGIAAALIAFGKSGFEQFFAKVVDAIVKRV